MEPFCWLDLGSIPSTIYRWLRAGSSCSECGLTPAATNKPRRVRRVGERQMQTDEERRARKAGYQRKYRATHPEEEKHYRATHKTKHAVEQVRYSAKYPDKMRAWHVAHPEQVRASARKGKAIRRTLGFLPINQPFDGCEGHHINQNDVIYIPKDLHMSVRHNVFTGKNMEQINVLACEWLARD